MTCEGSNLVSWFGECKDGRGSVRRKRRVDVAISEPPFSNRQTDSYLSLILLQGLGKHLASSGHGLWIAG